MLAELIQGVLPEQFMHMNELSFNQWANQISYFENNKENWREFDIALIGVYDYRLSRNIEEGINGADEVRKHLYQLFNWDNRLKFIDLGNILPGHSIRDTFVAVEQVVRQLLVNNVIPIIISNSQELTYCQYKAYEDLRESTSMAIFDECIDFNYDPDDPYVQSYIYKILAHRPNFLGNYLQLGYQHYLVNPDNVDTLSKMYNECYRLAYFLSDIRRIEPMTRQSDMISFDVSSIRYADAPGQQRPSPNGFSGHDACRIARYSGISDKMSSYGIYEYMPHKDKDGLTAHLLAQCIWHFAEGFYARKFDDPETFEQDYIHYNVAMNDSGEELIFLKSRRSDRWWMKVPIINSKMKKKFELVPCLKEEYNTACRKEIPDRWMHAYIKYSTTMV